MNFLQRKLMNMKTNLNKKLLYIYLWAILGLFLILYYIWFRFIRERLIRDIPYNLTIFTFLTLCIICIYYIYILYRIYKPLIKSHSILVIFQNLLLFLFKLFYFFDKLLRKNYYINKVITNLNIIFIKNFKLYTFDYNKYFFIFFYIFPRIFILITFMVDIFYFHKLHLFFYLLPLGILPLIFRYNIYFISKYLDIITNSLHKNYYVIILSTEEEEEEYRKTHNGLCFSLPLSCIQYEDIGGIDAVSTDYFISCQSTNLVLQDNMYKYTCIETWLARDYYIKKHNLKEPTIWIYKPESDEISKALAKEFRELMPRAYYLAAFLHVYNNYTLRDIIKYF